MVKSTGCNQSSPASGNRMVWRPLEGFISHLLLSTSPHSGNLEEAPALMAIRWYGNLRRLCLVGAPHHEGTSGGGTPGGVTTWSTLVAGKQPKWCSITANFAGLHFTGSQLFFNGMWGTIAATSALQILSRIVGETVARIYPWLTRVPTRAGGHRITRGRF